jgi:hypothetical protein
MSVAVSQTMRALCMVTQNLPIGTNLALLHFLWMLVSGALLLSRGAIFPALQAIGLDPPAVRRAWAALRYGSWEITDLLHAWEQQVTAQPHWQAQHYDGYCPKAVDLTPFWRPALQGCSTKHYHPQAGKALQAIVLGLVGRVGRVGGQRVVVLTALVRSDPEAPTESTLRARLLQRVAQTLADDEIPVLDAGFKISELQAAQLRRYVVRLAKNFTARRNTPLPYQGIGRRPEYGALVRPLARTFKGKTIAATPPDRVEIWTAHGRTFWAEIWNDPRGGGCITRAGPLSKCL